MKSAFPGFFYRPSDLNLEEIWQKCVFVPDANVLLSLYEYSAKSRAGVLDLFDKVADRLWIPHQVALEFLRNRLKVIKGTISGLDVENKVLAEAERSVNKVKENLSKKFRTEIGGKDEHTPSIFETIHKAINERKNELCKLANDDSVLDRIVNLFEGKVGPPYTDQLLEELYNQGAHRYERLIPPGHDDINKPGMGRYGDLILWSQIIDYAKFTKRTIVFITNDKKEDWWLFNDAGKKWQPRPELVDEMMKGASQEFWMHRIDEFLSLSKKYLDNTVAEDTIEEVREVSDAVEEENTNRSLVTNKLLADVIPGRGLGISKELLESMSRVTVPNILSNEILKLAGSYGDAQKQLMSEIVAEYVQMPRFHIPPETFNVIGNTLTASKWLAAMKNLEVISKTTNDLEDSGADDASHDENEHTSDE